MATLVLAVNPILAAAGQIAAIIICVFLLVFALLAVVIQLLMVFVTSWLNEKVELIKMLRPTVESVNKASEAAMQGVEPGENESGIARAVAAVPRQMHAIDRNVEQATDKVANAVIEFRARTVQAQTVLKAFLLPGTMRRAREVAGAEDQGLHIKSPGYRMLMERKAPEMPEAAAAPGDGYVQTVTASQLKHAPSR